MNPLRLTVWEVKFTSPSGDSQLREVAARTRSSAIAKARIKAANYGYSNMIEWTVDHANRLSKPIYKGI